MTFFLKPPFYVVKLQTLCLMRRYRALLDADFLFPFFTSMFTMFDVHVHQQVNLDVKTEKKQHSQIKPV